MNDFAVVSPNDPTQTTKKKVKISTAKSSSAYNLFYQYTRALQASDNAKEYSPTTYGLEHVSVELSPVLISASGDEIKAYRKRVIEEVLGKCADEEGAEPCKKRKKCNKVKMNFTELSQQLSNRLYFILYALPIVIAFNIN